MRALWTGYDYADFLQSMVTLGWENFAGPRRNWYAWAHGNMVGADKPEDRAPRGTPAEYGAFLRAEVERLRPQLLVLAKACDSNIPAPGCKPEFWHILLDDIAWVRKQGTIVVYLGLDDPGDFGFCALTNMWTEVDAIGTCCIGTREDYASYSTAPVFEFWPAWDRTRKLEPPKPEHVCDLAIVGSPYFLGTPERMGPTIARRDIALAAMEMGVKLHIYGGANWLVEAHGGDPKLTPCYKGPVDFADVHNVMAAAKVTYCSFTRQAKRYANDRIFLAGGAGAFLLMEDQLFLGQEFVEGVHCDWHRRGSLDSFRERLTYWLSHEEERQLCAARMRALVLERHTYKQRAELLDQVYREARARLDAKKSGCCGGGHG